MSVSKKTYWARFCMNGGRWFLLNNSRNCSKNRKKILKFVQVIAATIFLSWAD